MSLFIYQTHENLYQKYSKMKNFVQSVTIILFMIAGFNLNAQVKVGDKAPLFKAVDDAGDTWRLSDHLGKKIIVLYFYPAAMTSGCTAQACAYRDDKNMLSALGAEVVGVSGDKAENLKLFKQQYHLNFPLLEDPKGKIAGKYGVPVKEGGVVNKTMDGKTVTLKRGVTEMRWTFIIDMDGKIAYIDENVNAANDSKKVIEAIKKL